MFYYMTKYGWRRSDELPGMRYVMGNGVLAYGGEYTADCFLKAYRRGVFPWPSGEEDEEELVPWCCPAQRFVLEPSAVHVSHSLKKTLKKGEFSVCADRNFETVLEHCARYHAEKDGVTWITDGMRESFMELYRLGIAHSIECYDAAGVLVGGFYGTCFGTVFGGESMFTLRSDATKVAFVMFAKRASLYGMRLIDCQCYTENMARYGAKEVPRDEFLSRLEACRDEKLKDGFWSGQWPIWDRNED